MESESVVHDRVNITHMGHPTVPYPSLGSGQAIRSTYVTCWPLLDGDSIGGPLQTLLGKVKAKAWGVGTKTLITLVSKDVIAVEA